MSAPDIAFTVLFLWILCGIGMTKLLATGSGEPRWVCALIAFGWPVLVPLGVAVLVVVSLANAFWEVL